MITQRVFEWTLQPAPARLEVRAGCILRVAQVDGASAAFQLPNLYDYKEYMHCGRTRPCMASIPAKALFMVCAAA